MAKKSKQPKTPIPAALRQKLEHGASKHSVDQRNAQAPRGGHSPRRSVTRVASYSLTSGSAFSNASLCCPEPVLSSGYSPEKQASQCVERSPSIAA